MDEYVGVWVELQLYSGLTLTGQVVSVDPKSRELTLSQTKLQAYGMVQEIGIYKCSGSCISNLEVLETGPPEVANDDLESPTASSVPFPQGLAIPDAGVILTSPAESPESPILPKAPKLKKVPSKSSKNAEPRASNIRYNNSDTFGVQTGQTIDDDFDFQASLANFDKVQVFEEIKHIDKTLPHERLVHSNLRQKVPHNVNVLDLTEDTTDFEIDDDFSTSMVFQTTLGDVVPAVSRKILSMIEHTVNTETGPGLDILFENGGRGVAMLVLQAMVSKLNANPVVNVLIGNNKSGCYGLVAARHLTNHGIHVNFCIPGKSIDKHAETLLRYVIASGGVRYKISEMPRADLTIDAILGQNPSLHPFEMKMVEHAARLSCPILSIDIPSGCHPVSGLPSNARHVSAKWTCAMGMLSYAYTNCPSTVMGSIFLVDIGTPVQAIDRHLPFDYQTPFREKYLMLVKKI